MNASPTTLDPRVHYLTAFEVGQRARTGASPGWLSALREGAASRFAQLGFPHPKDEEWRATSLAPLLSVAFAPAPRPTLAQARAAFGAVRLGPAVGARLVFVDGSFVEELSTAVDLGGAVAQSLAAALENAPGTLEDHLGRASPQRGFTALNTALFTDGAFIHLPRGVSLEAPIELVFLATGRRESVFFQPRNLIVAEPGSRARIVERYLSAGEGPRTRGPLEERPSADRFGSSPRTRGPLEERPSADRFGSSPRTRGPLEERPSADRFGSSPYFTNAVTQIVAGDGAVLEHFRLQQEAKGAFHISEVGVRQGRDAQVAAHSYNAGTTLVRNDVAVSLAAPGARIALFGLSVTEGSQHVDNHTCIEHQSPNCASEEAYRAILGGASKSVFNGRIIVHEGAQKTDATQSNRSLLLSDDATVNTKPQLEIHADDVKCTHGAAVGQLDKEALFYLRSRGVGEEEARSMLTRAFASQVIDRVRIDWLRKVIEEQLLAGLGALQGAKA